MPKKSYSADIKVLAVQYLEEGRHTFEEIRTMFSVNMNTLQIWRALYKYGGVQALMRPTKNKVYPEELKRRAVARIVHHSLFSMSLILNAFYNREKSKSSLCNLSSLTIH